uniref:Regulating synaptic membrane exocytosis protein 2 n=1 Tax=Bombyx mori TaxID=7091 RepID=A0A8R2R205_BOMMO|nr:regulating synaptic membrane exocytosis protein 2 isoform X2 [Bombyx mori]
MADMPDLSHLTPEERAIIEGVIMRQRQEEQREHEIMRRKQDEVAVLEQTIRTRNELQRAAGVELAATCHICLKTKFADGVGHSCHYCRVRCCARCGGKVTLRSNKVIWVCILCRKKQELLSKTGQWIHKSTGPDSMLWRMESELRGLLPQDDASHDKRQKLERAHSAAEKENQPLQRSGSALRRQYSQQEQRCYGELEGLARTHPHLVHSRQKAAYGVVDTMISAPLPAQLLPHGPAGNSMPLPPRSSSSDDEVPECISDENDEYRDRGKLEACASHRHPHLRSANVAAINYYNLTNHSSAGYENESRGQFEHRTVPAGGRSFDSVTDCRWRARDESEGAYLRPYIPDEGPRPERAVYKSAYLWEDSSDNRRFTERRKKTVRFDGHEGAATFPRGGRDASGAPSDWASLRWESERQTSQDSATKDSGIDTSSTFTSSEDSNRGDCPKFPPSWQASTDGSRVIGHMVLRKSVVEGSSHSSAAILGLKVVGGKLLPDGIRGAIIEKVKKGSIADLEGQLRIGDEVLQWNGVPLQGRSAEEVAAVVADSKHDTHVELVVSRSLPVTRPGAQPWRSHKEVYTETMMVGGCEKPSVLVTSPGSPDVHSRRRSNRHSHHNANVAGRIQLKIYFDISALQLLVTVVSASGLTPRADGSPRCPYAKIFLLPDKSEKSKRRTKTLANTLEPRWNQTFVYCGIRITDIKKRTLEVTVWDLNRYGPNDFLGEVLLDLDNIMMNHEPNWYTLKPHEDSSSFYRYREEEADGDHLSPPSTSTSRLSDSDTPSECDLRRHHSLSSLASSSSPPPPHDRMDMEGIRSSRRDMSPASRVRTTGMYRDRSCGYSVARSQSAAGVARPQRARSKSPRRSLSPPADRDVWRYAVNDDRGGDGSRLPTHAYAPRFQSRSATATPTTSPKKRQLPQIPHQSQSTQRAVRAQVSADLEERKWIAPHHIGATLTYRSTPQGWERHYAGLSDSELAARSGGSWAPRRRLSPDATAADSDLESVASVTSSAFSTQSERPRPTRMLSRKRNIPLHSTSSSCDSAIPLPETFHFRFSGAPCRQLPILYVPAAAERVVRMRSCSKCASSISGMSSTQRATQTRTPRRIRGMPARSRSAGSCTRDCNRRYSYERSYSFPEYPVCTNAYKLTENNKECIIELPLSRFSKFTANGYILPKKVFYRPSDNEIRSSTHFNKRKIHLPQKVKIKDDQKPSSSDEDVYNLRRYKEVRRKLPDLGCFRTPRSLPALPAAITLNNNQNLNTTFNINSLNYNKKCNTLYTVQVETNDKINCEDSSKELLDANKTNQHSLSKYSQKNDRKNVLSLDLNAINNERELNINSDNYSSNTNNLNQYSDKNKENHKINQRRYSDSIIIKGSPKHNTSENLIDVFKMVNISANKSKDVDEADVDKSVKRKTKTNSVSINEVPTFQEYDSLNSFPPQPSIDLFLRKPLPSIIKNARPRSHSLVPSDRLDREISIIANCLSIALSPSNRNTCCRRALTPVASHLPHDDTDHTDHDSTAPSTSVVQIDHAPQQSTLQQKYNYREINKTNNSTAKTGKPTRRKTKHSNDYGGRDNGRNNNQPQPLERRESRRGQFTRSLSNADVPPDEKTDGSLSDTALGGTGELEPSTDDVLLKAEPRDYFGPGMGKKSNSTSQLSATESGGARRKRSGGTVTSFQRSHEVCAVSLLSISSSEGSSWSPGMRGSGSSEGGGLSDFIDGLGPGQLVGRQLLGATTLGDVQLSMCYQKGFLEVEVIRARGLQARQGSRTLPAPYVKVYLVSGKRCIAKAKTTTARRTLDPLYQQTLTFRENFKGCVLQVTVWGDYGRIEGKKVFMGVAQIMLDDINLSNIVIGWYKLFGTTSLVVTKAELCSSAGA